MLSLVSASQRLCSAILEHVIPWISCFLLCLLIKVFIGQDGYELPILLVILPFCIWTFDEYCVAIVPFLWFDWYITSGHVTLMFFSASLLSVSFVANVFGMLGKLFQVLHKLSFFSLRVPMREEQQLMVVVSLHFCFAVLSKTSHKIWIDWNEWILMSFKWRITLQG